eukprot:gene11192-12366_t
MAVQFKVTVADKIFVQNDGTRSTKLCKFTTPIEPPKLPSGALQLAVTPEKACSKKLRDISKLPQIDEKKKTVCFVEELPEVKDASVNKQEYQDLVEPQLNSTYGLSKKLEELRLHKFQKERALIDLNISESTLLNSVHSKTSSALNFKRKQINFEDLTKVDVDSAREIEKAAPKRAAYNKEKSNDQQKDNETNHEDIMSFWMEDLVTETAKFDYDEEFDDSIFEPDVCYDNFEYLTDFYTLKEIPVHSNK